MVTKKKKRHYVDNERFLQEIIEYKKQCREAVEKDLPKPRMSDYIGQCLLLIAKNFSTKPRFKSYSFSDEMVSDAIENCLLYFDNFDETKYSNPFAYFTQVTYFAFFRRIYKEEKNRYAIYKKFQESVLDTSDAALLVDGDNNHLVTGHMYDNLNDFIANFEQREAQKKQKRKAAKNAKQGLDKFYEE